MTDLKGKAIALAGDHAGFALKKAVTDALAKQGADIRDFGPASPERTDFPRHVAPAAAALARGEVWRAILIDGAGYPSGILANKFRGVYAAVANDPLSARLCREHSNANALCLGGQVVGQLLALEIVRTFLATEFDAAKYGARVAMVTEAEAANFGEAAPAESGLDVVTLADVQDALRERRSLLLKPGAALTPSVKDILRL